ncbi:thioredoxin-disulfide reductase [Candidatus Microgenomates bacterium]|nr:thioredoxin-disulfide reductase [Candidatus Microgenomates bacterium]
MNVIYDVAIIGSGPAGLTAAIYTSRAALSTLVIAGSKWGGQLMLTTTVENFPGFPDGIQGPELMEKMKAQAEHFGAKIVLSDVTKLVKLDKLDQFGLTTEKETYQARSLIIATGADTTWLNLPSEQRLIGHGVSSCAPCDAFFFKDKKVAVVGGGDAAMEEALVLTKFASKITIIHRRDTFRASKIMQDRVLSNPKIKVLWNTEITDVLGQDKVEGVLLKSGEKLLIDGLFIAIGHTPNTKIFADLVELDEKGYVKKTTDAEHQDYPTMTNIEGVFVSGDVHDYRYKQAITAAGFGCQAALDVEKWLENRS